MQSFVCVEDGAARRAASAGTLLLVDGHPLVRHGFSLALRDGQPGTAVAEAGSLDEALRLMERIPDLVLALADLPLLLPAEEGLQRMLAALGPVPLLVLADDADPAVIRGVVRAGARGCVLKSGTAAVLEHAVKLALTGDTFLPLPRAVLSGGTAGTPAASPVPRVDDLTDRQREVFDLLLAGQSNKEIARVLGVLEGTVKVHVRAIMQKLGVRNRTQAAVLAASTLARSS